MTDQCAQPGLDHQGAVLARAREDTSLPEVMREYGHIWSDAPKVLVSRARHSAGHGTRIIGGDDAIEQLAALKAGTDGTIGVGGANLATQLLRAGLLDELLLFTHPTVLGSAGRCSTTTTARSSWTCSSNDPSSRA